MPLTSIMVGLIYHIIVALYHPVAAHQCTGRRHASWLLLRGLPARVNRRLPPRKLCCRTRTLLGRLLRCTIIMHSLHVPVVPRTTVPSALAAPQLCATGHASSRDTLAPSPGQEPPSPPSFPPIHWHARACCCCLVRGTGAPLSDPITRSGPH